MSYLFTSESVSEGHPDKIADQISDAILDHFLAFDTNAKVACETLVTTGLVMLAGEIKSSHYVDVQSVVRETIRQIGYTKSAYKFEAESCGILSTLHEQSADINRGVERKARKAQGAGDQGMMFGFATRETPEYISLAPFLARHILQTLAQIRKQEKSPMPYLRPDAKAQVTVRYDDRHRAQHIDTIVLSTQHDDGVELKKIKQDVHEILMPKVISTLKSTTLRKLFNTKIKYHINPTGKFVIGGPHGDSGLTGRKIIVDTYGGACPHGGGAFSGKDPSKVDRSAAYAARHIAKNMVAAGLCDTLQVQLAYAIGVNKPVSVAVDTFGTARVQMSDDKIAKKIEKIFDLTPYGIEHRLGLRAPIYQETAKYGHFGHAPKTISREFETTDGKAKKMTLHLFTWERLDYVDRLKKEFRIK